MEEKKLVRKVHTIKTVKDFGSSVIVTYMAVLFASSKVQLPGSGDHIVWCTGGESGSCHPQAAVADWAIRLHNWVTTSQVGITRQLSWWSADVTAASLSCCDQLMSLWPVDVTVAS